MGERTHAAECICSRVGDGGALCCQHRIGRCNSELPRRESEFKAWAGGDGEWGGKRRRREFVCQHGVSICNRAIRRCEAPRNSGLSSRVPAARLQAEEKEKAAEDKAGEGKAAERGGGGEEEHQAATKDRRRRRSGHAEITNTALALATLGQPAGSCFQHWRGRR